MHIKKIWLSTLLLLLIIKVNAQDVNLDSMLDKEIATKSKNETQYTEATFKTSRLIDGHTIETTQKGILDFKVSHRFGRVNEGFYNMFGLDIATMRIGGDYGITNNLTIGVGRSTFEKQYDGFLKYKLIRQSSGKINMPVTVALLASAMFITDTVVNPWNAGGKVRTSDKLAYAYQVMIARKFSSDFSVQIMPTLVHDNLVALSGSPNDLFAIGIGSRLKLTKRSSINIEYYYQLPGYKLPGTYNTLSVGYEIETGGHVFQFHLSNSRGMTENTFITENTGRWDKGDIHLGFNISRVFTIKHYNR